MSARRLVVLALAAALLAGVALWMLGDRRAGQELPDTGPLLPELMQRLNDLERIVLTGAGGQTLVAIERGEAGWRVAQRAGYPADAAKVRELLLALARAQRLEAKTANPDMHPRLGLADVAGEDAQGVQVAIEGGDYSTAVLVGQGRTGGKGTYVRLADQAQAWLVDAALAPERDPARWIERDLADIAVQRIATVEVEHPDGERTQIRAEQEGRRFAIANLPAGRVAQGEFVAEGTAGLLASLRIDDVRAEADAPAAEEGDTTRARFTTVEGIVVDVEGWQYGGRTWARLDARLDEAAAHAWLETQASAGEADVDADVDVDVDGQDAADAGDMAAAAPARSLEDLRAEAAALDARVQGWVFELPGYKAGNLLKGREDYLAPRE